MKNGKILFFGIVILVCFVQTVFAMELAIYDNELEEIRSCLQGKQFLPDDSEKDRQFSPNHSDELNHLLYLSTINSNNTKTLFTQRQQRKFDACSRMQKSVNWSFGVNGAIIVGTALLPFMNFSVLSQCFNATQTDCLSQVVAITMPTVGSVVTSLGIGLSSLWATGYSPHIAAGMADGVQDDISHLREEYATLAKYWIDMYFDSPEKAKFIAEKFDIVELKKRSQLKMHKEDSSGYLISDCEEAYHYIKYNSFLKKLTLLELYIGGKIKDQKLELQGKELEVLKADIETLKNKKDI